MTRLCSVLLAAFVALALLVAGGDALRVHANRTTVSGLSAGAFFATQMHVAYSSHFIGSAVFAGGPYYCAQDSLETAMMDCMYVPMLISQTTLVNAAKGFANSNEIDGLGNLTSSRLFFYSGTMDTVVNTGVVKAGAQFYQNLGVSSSQIQTQFTTPSEHCMPTNSFGESCSHLGSPYINDCNLDGAGDALQWMLGSLKQPVTPVSSNVHTISQQQFTPNGEDPSEISMGPNAYVYIPTACANNQTDCIVHVALHGCEQTVDDIGSDYYTKTGFNNWAESNGIIVIYPQAIKQLPNNEGGCFDWWGYTESSYALRSGPQMATVFNLLQHYVTQQ